MDIHLFKETSTKKTVQNKDMNIMHNLWTPEDQRLMERLKWGIMEGPKLAIPDSSHIFYIKTDW